MLPIGNKSIFWLMGAIVLCSACAVKKSAAPAATTHVKSTPKMPVYTELDRVCDQLATDTLYPDYVKMQAKAAYSDPDQSMDLNLRIVAEPGKYIWIRVTALLGIEAARIRFEPTQVRILDPLHRKYIIASYSYIERIVGVPFGFEQMQRLLFGKALYSADKANSELQTNTLRTQIGNIIQLLMPKPGFTGVVAGDLQDVAKNRSLKIRYQGNMDTNRKNIPESIIVNVLAEKKIDCVLNLSNFVFEKKDEAPFNPPASYQEVHY